MCKTPGRKPKDIHTTIGVCVGGRKAELFALGVCPKFPGAPGHGLCRVRSRTKPRCRSFRGEVPGIWCAKCMSRATPFSLSHTLSSRNQFALILLARAGATILLASACKISAGGWVDGEGGWGQHFDITLGIRWRLVPGQSAANIYIIICSGRSQLCQCGSHLVTPHLDGLLPTAFAHGAISRIWPDKIDIAT